jgi:16S rRNA (uracil1498-N3)-methyltransferase
LRLRPGAHVIALDGSGREYDIELIELNSDGGLARVCASREALTEPRVSLVLYQGMLRGQRFEWVLQKGTELGVSAFVPTETRRVVADSSKRWRNKRARWERIIREAAEQSRRGRLPRLADPLPFADACREAASCDLALIPAVLQLDAWDAVRTGDTEKATDVRGGLAGRVRAPGAAPRSVALLIGPEGGFARQEIDLARNCGVQVVSLGPRVLRAETAALATVTIVLSALGEMG